MKFFETYFTRHHFVHTPHKWFVALLVSPIHAAEVHYKQRYHLTFAHAKKLFFIDMTLLASIIVLLGASIYWFAYDPTVTDQVRLSLTSSEERIKSGDYVTFTLNYKNTSDVVLESPSLSIALPPGFVLDTEKMERVDPTHSVISLPELPPKQEGTQTFSGWFYGEPGQEIPTAAAFSYTQPTRTIRESKAVRLLSTLRGSVTETTVDTTRTILQTGSTPITITIKNTSDHTLPPLRIPLNQTIDGIRLEHASSSDSIILEPHQVITLQGSLVADLPSHVTQTTYILTPSFLVRGASLPQLPVPLSFSVVHPSIALQGSWSSDFASPRGKPSITLTLKNTGGVDLKDTELSLDLPLAIVDINGFRQQNNVRGEGTKAVFTSQDTPILATLRAGQESSFNIVVPIKNAPQGTDITLALRPTVSAQVDGVSHGAYSTTADLTPLPIGTSMGMDAELRYYTDEGDQLGRGPLPPVVGKETKYWALVQIANGSSNAEDVRFRATLPSHITWTGRTSVSHGRDITFDQKTRTVSWGVHEIAAHTTVGLYIELGLTPTGALVGTSPIVMSDMSVTARDTHIGQELTSTHPPLDISIRTDEIGKQKGTAVGE